jgi:glycerol-3-phosphate O-acyltransferase / dihydroxyacetone phosphate acyltransferase
MKHKEQAPMTNWVYDVFLWTFSILIDMFFREVHPRGSWKVPRRGPVIFVAAPHANQVCVLSQMDQDVGRIIC